MPQDQIDPGPADDAQAYPGSRSRLPKLGIFVMLLMAGGLALYSGYIWGKSDESKKEVRSPAAKIVLVQSAQKPEPLARGAMEKAAVLMHQNMYAFEQTYLKKRYRVIGKIARVVGPKDTGPYFGPVFVVDLERWANLGKWLSQPRLAFIALPNEVQLSLRPGQEVDATCVLEEWMSFEGCRLNRPLLPEKEPGQDGATAVASGPTAKVATVAMSSRQSSEGVTEDQMDQEFLSRLEQWSLGRMRVHTSKAMKSRGQPFDPADLSAESLFVEAGGKKLAVTRFKVGTVTTSAEIVGIVGDELVRVMCMTNVSDDLVITRGPCNDKIKESLGVSLDPRD